MINLITFDGTASQAPTDFEISETMNADPTLTVEQRRLGGGFPANVAVRLMDPVTGDPTNWNWVPMDYKPGFRIQSFFDLTFEPFEFVSGNKTWDIPQKTGSIGRALAMLGAKLPTLPGPIVLCGLSQGAWICSLAYHEFVHPQGLFHDRVDDLKAIINFGSPRRIQSHTIPLPGAIRPLGQGAANFAHELSFGNVPGLVQDPPSWMWEFCMLDDAASDSSTDPTVASALAAVTDFLYDGDFESGIGLTLTGRLSDFITNVFGAVIWNQIKPGAENPFALSKWLPFVAGLASGDPRVGNPHAQYNSYPYDMLITSPIVANTQYRGTWNAATNTPALANGTGTSGHLYKVFTAGTRNLGSGNVAWAKDDYVIYANGTWQKAVKNTKSAVDLAFDYLLELGAQYATEPVVPLVPAGYTWWQTPPD